MNLDEENDKLNRANDMIWSKQDRSHLNWAETFRSRYEAKLRPSKHDAQLFGQTITMADGG